MYTHRQGAAKESQKKTAPGDVPNVREREERGHIGVVHLQKGAEAVNLVREHHRPLHPPRRARFVPGAACAYVGR